MDLGFDDKATKHSMLGEYDEEHTKGVDVGAFKASKLNDELESL